MSTLACDLARGQCKPCEGGIPPLDDSEVARLLEGLHDWAVADGVLRREFDFPDHYATMTFVNAVAWISHRQGHHPDVTLGYNTCRVAYVTHAVSGLTESDFICAAKVDALFNL